MGNMKSATETRLPSLEEAAAFSPRQIVDLAGAHLNSKREVEALKHQLDWFKRQIFGQKSERRIVENGGGQMSLGEVITLKQTACHRPPLNAPSRPIRGER